MATYEKKRLKILGFTLFFILALVLVNTYVLGLYFPNKGTLMNGRSFKALVQKTATINSINICQEAKSPADCKLEPGDILIKRALTGRTILASRIFNLYFTHTAIYTGNGYVVEAKGFLSNTEDEITEEKLVDTDWDNQHIESWVIIRPLVDDAIRNSIVTKAKEYANSPNKKFGLTSSDTDIYCSKLIWDIYKDANYPINKSSYTILSPDELFELLQHDQNRFKIINLTTST